MTRNLKVLGLALVAVFAMSAMAASAASAHTPATFTVEKEKSTIRGEETGIGVLEVTGVATECEVATFHGVSAAGTVSTQSQAVIPTYEECFAESIFGTINVTVDGFGETGCEYIITSNGRAHLHCDSGHEVTITAATCTIHIPPQTDLGTLSFTTENTLNVKHDLLVHVDLDGLTTNHTDGFGCPLPSGGESATGSLEVTSTVWAESPPGVKVHLTWDQTV